MKQKINSHDSALNWLVWSLFWQSICKYIAVCSNLIMSYVKTDLITRSAVIVELISSSAKPKQMSLAWIISLSFLTHSLFLLLPLSWLSQNDFYEACFKIQNYLTGNFNRRFLCVTWRPCWWHSCNLRGQFWLQDSLLLSLQQEHSQSSVSSCRTVALAYSKITTLWWRAHREHLERRGPFKEKLGFDKQDQSGFFLPVEPLSNSSIHTSLY